MYMYLCTCICTQHVLIRPDARTYMYIHIPNLSETKKTRCGMYARIHTYVHYITLHYIHVIYIHTNENIYIYITCTHKHTYAHTYHLSIKAHVASVLAAPVSCRHAKPPQTHQETCDSSLSVRPSRVEDIRTHR